jgi:hypothetical protein
VFTDAEKHGELTGAKVTASRKDGAMFSAFDGFVTGWNLVVVPGRLSDLYFREATGGVVIQMIHAGVPRQFEEKWSELYWPFGLPGCASNPRIYH